MTNQPSIEPITRGDRRICEKWAVQYLSLPDFRIERDAKAKAQVYLAYEAALSASEAREKKLREELKEASDALYVAAGAIQSAGAADLANKIITSANRARQALGE